MKELLLIVVMTVIFIIGYYMMERIDRFLRRSRRERLEGAVRKRDLLTGNAAHHDLLLIWTAYSGKSIKKVIL